MSGGSVPPFCTSPSPKQAEGVCQTFSLISLP